MLNGIPIINYQHKNIDSFLFKSISQVNCIACRTYMPTRYTLRSPNNLRTMCSKSSTCKRLFNVLPCSFQESEARIIVMFSGHAKARYIMCEVRVRVSLFQPNN